MADIKLKNVSGSGADGTIGVSATGEKIRLIAIDDYSKFGLEVTSADGGTVTIYEVALTERVV